MRSHPSLHRLGLSVVGVAFTALFACDPNTSDRSLESQHEDCGCQPKPDKPHHKPHHKPGPKPEKPDHPDKPDQGECGPDGPQPECHAAFHLCVDKGGTKDECAPLLDMCKPPGDKPPPPADDCKQQFVDCIDQGAPPEKCQPLLDACQPPPPPPQEGGCDADFKKCVELGGTDEGCAPILKLCRMPQPAPATTVNPRASISAASRMGSVGK